jgi:hypothetical protein
VTRILFLALALWLVAGCAAPAPARPTAEATIAAFTAAGLEAERPSKMTRADYGPAPYLAEGTRFLIPSLGADAGGRLFIGADADLDKLEKHYAELGKASAWFYSHLYRRPGVLVQINGELPDEKAQRYKAALEAVR